MSTIAACAETPVTEPDVPALLVTDRCDTGCTAQALVRVRMPSGNLLDFCNHHHRAHEPALAAQGAEVIETVQL